MDPRLKGEFGLIPFPSFKFRLAPECLLDESRTYVHVESQQPAGDWRHFMGVDVKQLTAWLA